MAWCRRWLAAGARLSRERKVDGGLCPQQSSFYTSSTQSPAKWPNQMSVHRNTATVRSHEHKHVAEMMVESTQQMNTVSSVVGNRGCAQLKELDTSIGPAESINGDSEIVGAAH